MNKKEDKKNKHNLPYYMNNGGNVEVKPEEIEEPEKIRKFKLGIGDGDIPLITIDNTTHKMNPVQFHAFTCGIIKLNKKINPEVEYRID